MTIIAKPIRDKGLEKPLASEIIDFPANVNLANSNDSQGDEMELWLSPSTRRRISTTTTVCVFITALIVMSIGIIGGVYLYRQMTQHQHMSGFTGWCGIPFEKDTLHFSRKNSILGPNRPFFKEENHAEWGLPDNMFREEFDLDLSSGLFMKISVPDFGYGMRVQFLHDFGANKTGIVLHDQRKCYVMPLDRRNTKPPQDIFDLVRKMWDGSHNINNRVVYKKMTVIHPEITDLSVHGKHIEKHCSNYRTYMLQEAELQGRRYKRSAHQAEVLAEFAGENIVEFSIEDAE